MEKIWKIILTGVVLMAIAVPLAFIIGHNARARMDKFASQGIDVGLGLNTLGAIDKAKEATQITDQTNQEITQMIESLVGTTTLDETISTSTASSTINY
ncbi:MAG: hypothetical protein V1819_01810 [bacterium]